MPWTTVGQAGPDEQTSNIAAVIQEIVNRPGWSSNNALAIVITGTGQRVAEAALARLSERFGNAADGSPIAFDVVVIDRGGAVLGRAA